MAAGQPGTAVGRSCHDLDEVAAAVGGGASYVTLSPFAATPSKPGYGPAQPPATYAAARRLTAGSATRVLALGGVDARNVAAAMTAGAHGVAVMGAVMRATDPAAEVAALLAELAHPRGEAA
nr:thiamine phosphate synthase [Nocardioides zeae]